MKITDFKKLYNKPRFVIFQKNPSKEDYRAIERNFMESPEGKRLDEFFYHVRAVYPVLCVFSDFNEKKPIHISQKNIGTYAGIKSSATVDQAIGTLHKLGWIKRFKQTKDGRRLWYYNVNFIRANKQKELSPVDDYFIFRTWIVKKGLWAKLSNKAKSLYLGLLANSKNEIWTDDVDRYDGRAIWRSPDGVIYDLLIEQEFKNALAVRNWSDFHGSIKELCEIIGISPDGASKALKELEKVGLIEVVAKIDYRGLYLIKVF